jgi:putative transposase
MASHHKNIRLPLDRYRGTAWFFVTFCCEHRRKYFRPPTTAQWFLDRLRITAASHAVAVLAYCVMPDHVHLLTEGLTLSTDLLVFLSRLKQKTGFEHKQRTGQQLWQKKSYDHALRSGDHPEGVAWYIWMNPVRAKLCNRVNEYAWSGSLTHAMPQAALGEEWSPSWRRNAEPRAHLKTKVAAT